MASLLLLLSLLTAAHAQTTTGTTANGFIYTGTNSQITITGYYGTNRWVSIPDTISGMPVIRIGWNAFAGGNLISVTIPSSVIDIEEDAFWWCTSLTYVTTPDCHVATVGDEAFAYCQSLTSIVIPSSVTSIGDYAFLGCTGVKSFTVAPDNPSYSSVDGVLFDKSQTMLINYPMAKAGDYTIPNGVTSFGWNAFSACAALSGIVIPNSITRIDTNEFAGCTSLASVTIPKSVASIGDGAFYNCTSLSSITLPDGLTNIGDALFLNCTSLTSITIPQSVTNIGRNAFAGTNLTSVTIPSRVTSIGDSAFSSCTLLRAAVFMGDAPTLVTSVFASTASGFTAYYFNEKRGFTSPAWNSYKAVNLDSSPVFAENQMSLTYYAGDANVTCFVQTSTDLKAWSTDGVTTSAPDSNNMRTATVPTTGPHRFMRLVVVY